MFYITRIHQEEMNRWSGWIYESIETRDTERSHWIDTTVKLVNQLKSRIVSYVRHIEKMIESSFVNDVDEHEDMFNIL